MIEEMKKAPAIRFRDFTDDWEQSKVGDICSISTGKSNTQDKVDDGKYPFYVRSPIIEHSNKYLYDEEAVLTVGDGVGTGKVFHYVNGKYDLHQRVYRIHDFSKDVSAKFFYNYFSKNFYKRVMAMTAKTSVDSVRYEMIADMKIQLPTITEQKKVADFFWGLDNLINLYQRKLDQQKKLKKYFLQNMFPAKGEKVPRIRFKGFTGDWEQRKLEDLAEVNPKSVIPEKFEYVDLESVVGTEIIAHRTETRDSAPSRAQRLAKKGDVFYQTVRPYQKNNCLFEGAERSYVFSTGYAQLRPHGDSYFLLTMLQRKDFVNNVLNRCTGTSYPAINANILAELTVSCPVDIQEQIKIGQYFKRLDYLITLHQRKLDQLQTMKKFMLQNMFI
ncbi:restriction endonuclease subunit S [uncultured Mitsuokella sp.]|uniref:restriction endonuclease subunit S n=1 Tax=uncultured Mitsuokella sp. TaxID=453120 RepID=UPI00262A9E50|nr:restriction endonuclease subunit S [uncultured Mitsuokella sp.]